MEIVFTISVACKLKIKERAGKPALFYLVLYFL